ncbi:MULTISPECIES: SHOCT domain-containing protein [unclassified Cryobacterium]|uniref:SHOCT domain-containing protein n=1 Tax=unclassified Cryobacterium TaxID=2649013 RepID=UPI001E49E341|nr:MULTISPECIES: hypothetical protein [unclassified Cryobacterium]
MSKLAARPGDGDSYGHGGMMNGGFGFGWWFLLIPLFWIIVVAVLFAIFGRRWRRGMREGHGHPGGQGQADATSAEKTLAERFAQGDIDEVEYRARLEVLRANRPDSQAPPA